MWQKGTNQIKITDHDADCYTLIGHLASILLTMANLRRYLTL